MIFKYTKSFPLFFFGGGEGAGGKESDENTQQSSRIFPSDAPEIMQCQ